MRAWWRFEARATTVKTRIMAHQHQMVRTDREATEPIDAAVEAKLLAQVGKVLTRGAALIVSDYQKGVVTRSFMRALIALARSRRAHVLVDPKVRNIGFFRGAFLVTPNQKEAEEISGITIRTDGDAERAVHRIARIAGTEGALVTRGEEGMSLGLRVGRKFSLLARAGHRARGLRRHRRRRHRDRHPRPRARRRGAAARSDGALESRGGRRGGQARHLERDLG